MLKLKNNVDKQELLKFGLKEKEDIYGNTIYYDGRNFDISKNGYILARNGGNKKRFDVLYDLIQAGLVEKVSD